MRPTLDLGHQWRSSRKRITKPRADQRHRFAAPDGERRIGGDEVAADLRLIIPGQQWQASGHAPFNITCGRRFAAPRPLTLRTV